MTKKSSRTRLRRWLARVLGGLAVLVLLMVLLGYVGFRQSLPQLDGTIISTGVGSPVTVTRDAEGVPTVKAVTRVDATYVLGYLHAQERFFQMDLLRRVGAGELAALLGDGVLGVDRIRRRHRFRHKSERMLKLLSANELAIATAYTAGVNDGRMALDRKPFEYTLLGTAPEAWTNSDSLLVVYAMYFDLQDEDNRFERNYALMHDVMGAAFADFLVPRGTAWDAPLDNSVLPLAPIPAPPIPAPLSSTAATPSPDVVWRQDSAPPVDEVILGSNNWVVGGALTTTGAAIVANDMHLGLGVPNIWYRARLQVEATDTDITGVTLPGTPAFVVGSNTHIAWGFTNSQTDTQDIVYLDWIDEAGGIYQTPAGPAQIESITEVICSSSGNCSDLQVRETIWGPLLAEPDHTGRAMVTRWIAHDAGAVNMHLMQMENARTVEQAFAIAHRTGSPAQNLVVGDENGNIGYTLLGPLPARFGHSGRLPSSWANGDRGWNGRLAPPNIPAIINPPEHRLWSANARIVSGQMLSNVGFGNYALAGRQHQVRKRLQALEHANEEDLLAIQLDDEALFLARWRALMLEHFASTTQTDLAAAREKIENWEGRAVPASVGYRLVRRFRSHVIQRVISGLSQPLEPYLGKRFPWYSRTAEGPVWRLINERPRHLLPPGYEDWNSVLAAAMDDVLQEVDQNGGLEAYTWGAYTELAIDHPMSAFVPGLGWLTDTPHEQTAGEFGHMPRIGAGGIGASERMVVSPGHEENGFFHMPSGQSGHPLSPYFNKGHQNWVKGAKSPFLPGETRWSLVFTPAN